MTTKKIRYLLEERGRYYYQRKVPKALTHALKMDRWHMPVGHDFETATDRVKELKKEHDTLITEVKSDPSLLVTLRREGEARVKAKADDKTKPFQDFMAGVRRGDIDCYPARVELAFQDVMAAKEIAGWEKTPDFLHDLKEARKPSVEIDFGSKRNAEAGPVTEAEYNAAAAPYTGIAPPEFFDKWRKFYVGTNYGFTFNEVAPITGDEFSDRLSEYLEQHFTGASAPSDEDDRLEFDMFKIKLERLVARYAPSSDKLSNVFDKFLTFNDIKTERKYRRVIAQFLKHSGDIPISQVTAKMLRGYRDKLLSDGLQIATVKAAFTPIKSLFRYAVDEDIIETNPAREVSFPKDARSIQEVKALPFTQEEAARILGSVDKLWLKPFPHLDDNRQLAIRQIVRALAFTGARPIELMSLTHKDVTEDAINIRRTKTKSSWRYIPVHPEIADFPAFVANGGIECLLTNNTDPVEPVRHNFIQLLRKYMENPVLEPRKKLYSFRASFQDAMRRAGAPMEVRQAVLGHVEGGAIKHYDSGPEFDLMREWVIKADPRK